MRSSDLTTTHGDNLDAYGGFTDVVGQRTGFFHVEKIDGRWWLVTPDGHGFFGIGLSHPVTSMSQAAVTFTYNGSQEDWLRDGIRKMRELGFNCVWSGPYSQERIRDGFVDAELAERVYRESEIPHAIHVPLVKHAVELEPGEKRPDVFDSAYEQFVADEVAKWAVPYKDNPWLLGYYYGFGSFMRESEWLNETLGRKMGSPGRERLLGILAERYEGNITAFNTVYETKFGSFDELSKSGTLTYPDWITAVKWGRASIPNRDSPDKNSAERILADADALLGELIEQVYKLAHAEIRKHDPNHMILGCYVKDATYTKEIWARVAPYVSLLAPQNLSDGNPIKPVVEATGLPAVLGDQEFGNVYALPLQGHDRSPGSVPEHVDRRVLYDLSANRIGPDPDFIGVSFCACLFDQSHWTQAYDRGQPGFFSIDGEPNQDLIKTVQAANAQMMEAVRRPLDEGAIAGLHRTFHETKGAYQLIMQTRKQLLQKDREGFK